MDVTYVGTVPSQKCLYDHRCDSLKLRKWWVMQWKADIGCFVFKESVTLCSLFYNKRLKLPQLGYASWLGKYGVFILLITLHLRCCLIYPSWKLVFWIWNELRCKYFSTYRCNLCWISFGCRSLTDKIWTYVTNISHWEWYSMMWTMKLPVCSGGS
jgi:hypothetical protein